jgi:hypothetical protein
VIAKEQLIDAYNLAKAAVDSWNSLSEQEAKSIAVPYRGKKVVGLSEQVLEAFSVLIGHCLTRDVENEPATRAIVLAVDQFAITCNAWWQQVEQGSGVNPSGTQKLWDAFAAIGSAIDSATRSWQLPTPIGQQPKGTALQTIANQYGWTVQQVTEEIAMPGTHYDPKTWVHPSRRAMEKRINEQWASRKVPPRVFSHLSDPPAPSKPEPEKPKSVSVEQLQDYFDQGMSPQQIANITGLPVQDVRDFGVDIGFAGEPQQLAPVTDAAVAVNHEQEKEIEQETAKAFAVSHPEVTDIDVRILACHRDGMKPRRICELINRDRSGVTLKRVIATIKASETAKVAG